jgi:hypothetical protein
VVAARIDALTASASSALAAELDAAAGAVIAELAFLSHLLVDDPEQPARPYTHVYHPAHQERTAECAPPEPAAREQPPPGWHTPDTLAATAHIGDSHIWVTAPLPAACRLVTIGAFDCETHRLDQGMHRAHDAGRHAVWLETPLRGSWPAGSKVTAA